MWKRVFTISAYSSGAAVAFAAGSKVAKEADFTDAQQIVIGGVVALVYVAIMAAAIVGKEAYQIWKDDPLEGFTIRSADAYLALAREIAHELDKATFFL